MQPAPQLEARLRDCVDEVRAQLERLLAIREGASSVARLLAADGEGRDGTRALDAFTQCLAAGATGPQPPH